MNKTKNKDFLPEMKDVKLNFKVDEPTENGRVYKRNDIERTFRKALETKPFIPITRNYSEMIDDVTHKQKVPLYEDIIGKFIDFEIRKNGEVVLKIRPTIDTKLFDNFKATSMIDGKLNEDNTVEIHALIGFFLAHNIDKILEGEGK